jgi:exopolyphosphatase/guanosine-5'-triphosphate,3'-diphosphate pyrophosphatase
LDIPSKEFLLVDLGGGSTEIILKIKDNIIVESFRFGIVTFTQKYKTPEAIKYAARKVINKRVKEFLNGLFLGYKKPKIMVASSGTPTTIAALKNGMNYKNYDPKRVNGTIITIKDLDYWLDKLLSMEMKKREELVGVGRGDLIVSGIYLFKEIMKVAKYKECIVCDDGLREGVAIEACNKI